MRQVLRTCRLGAGFGDVSEAATIRRFRWFHSTRSSVEVRLTPSFRATSTAVAHSSSGIGAFPFRFCLQASKRALASSQACGQGSSGSLYGTGGGIDATSYARRTSCRFAESTHHCVVQRRLLNGNPGSSRTLFRGLPETVRLHRGIGVHLHPGILFAVIAEHRSGSSGHRVHVPPDSHPKEKQMWRRIPGNRRTSRHFGRFGFFTTLLPHEHAFGRGPPVASVRRGVLVQGVKMLYPKRKLAVRSARSTHRH